MGDACRTLPSNLALCVHPEFVYVKARDPSTGRVYLVAEALLHELPGAVPKDSKKKDKSQPKKGGFEVWLHLGGSHVCLPACPHAKQSMGWNMGSSNTKGLTVGFGQQLVWQNGHRFWQSQRESLCPLGVMYQQGRLCFCASHLASQRVGAIQHILSAQVPCWTGRSPSGNRATAHCTCILVVHLERLYGPDTSGICITGS